MSIALGKIHTLLADYKHAMKRVKKGLKVAEGILFLNLNLLAYVSKDTSNSMMSYSTAT